MIQDLWDRQVDAIIDVKLGENDADTYKYEPMSSLLARWEKIKKDKHGKHCHDQRIFLTFVVSADGTIGREALVVLSQSSRFMSTEKGKEPLLQLWGWVNGRIANRRCEGPTHV